MRTPGPCPLRGAASPQGSARPSSPRGLWTPFSRSPKTQMAEPSSVAWDQGPGPARLQLHCRARRGAPLPPLPFPKYTGTFEGEGGGHRSPDSGGSLGLGSGCRGAPTTPCPPTLGYFRSAVPASALPLKKKKTTRRHHQGPELGEEGEQRRSQQEAGSSQDLSPLPLCFPHRLQPIDGFL